MAETCPEDRTIWRLSAVSKAPHSAPRDHRDEGDRVFGQVQAYQRTIRSKTIVHLLILRVVTCAKFYQTIFEIASNSSRANTFRHWFHERRNISEKEIVQEYIEVLKEIPWIQRLPSKIIRFAFTTGIDFVPVVGKVVSFLDQFIVEQIITGKSPKYFIEDLRKFTGKVNSQ